MLCDLRLPLGLQYLLLAFGLLPSIVFVCFATNVSGRVFVPSSGSGENVRNWDTPAYVGIAQSGSGPVLSTRRSLCLMGTVVKPRAPDRFKDLTKDFRMNINTRDPHTTALKNFVEKFLVVLCCY